MLPVLPLVGAAALGTVVYLNVAKAIELYGPAPKKTKKRRKK